MKVVYYAKSCYLDSALHQVRSLSRRVALHVLIEAAPESASSNMLSEPPRLPSAGVFPAEEALVPVLPPGARRYLDRAAGAWVVNHTCARSVHPATWLMSARAAALVREIQPDLIHLDDVSLRLAPAQSLMGSAPSVVSVHDASPHPGEGSWRITLPRKMAHGRASAFIVHNDSDADEFRRSQRDLAVVASIPLGTLDVFTEWSAPDVAEDEATVLFFGRLSPYKGLEVFYDAVRIVADRLPTARFVVAGRPVAGYRPPDPPPLPDWQIDVTTSHVSSARAAELFQRATIVVLPYLEATQSGVLLTAYAFGKPVVATRVGGLPQFVKDGVTGLLVEPGNHGALAQAMLALLADPRKRDRMKRGIRQRATTDLSWDAIADQTVSVYETVLSSRRWGRRDRIGDSRAA